MRYVAMFLILLSLASCTSTKSSSINAAMGVPEMLINGEFDQKSLIGAATAKRKPTIPVDENDPRYSYPLEGGFYEDPACSSDEEYDKYMKTLDENITQ